VDADRSVLVTIAPYAGEKIILTAQVVSSGGKVLQEIEPATYPRISRTAFPQSIGTALHDFVPKLQIFEANPDSPAQAISTATENTTTAAPPSGGSPTSADANASRRTAAIVVGAAGLVLAGAGGYFIGDARSRTKSFNDLYGTSPPGVEQEDRLASLAALRSGALRSQTLGFAGIGVGGAAVIAGVVLFLSSSGAKPVLSDARWLIGPGSIAVRIDMP
jgi:hypothetical protein